MVVCIMKIYLPYKYFILFYFIRLIFKFGFIPIRAFASKMEKFRRKQKKKLSKKFQHTF